MYILACLVLRSALHTRMFDTYLQNKYLDLCSPMLSNNNKEFIMVVIEGFGEVNTKMTFNSQEVIF